MKPATVFLGEMTNLEVEAFLQSHHTVIVPVGATEQHGPHGAAADRRPDSAGGRAPRRAAVGAVVAPPVNYALSYPHVGLRGLVHIRIPTFMALIEDLCVSLRRPPASSAYFPERPLRQYLRDRVCLRERRRQDGGRGAGVSHQLLGRLDRGGIRGVLRVGEGAARERRRDLGRAGDQPRSRRSWRAPTPSSRRSRSSPSTPAPSTRRSSSPRPAPSSAATRSGTWGDARDSTPRSASATSKRAFVRPLPCSTTSSGHSLRCRNDRPTDLPNSGSRSFTRHTKNTTGTTSFRLAWASAELRSPQITS